MLPFEFRRPQWQGRVDQEEPETSIRFHQRVQVVSDLPNYRGAPVLMGMASDEGVRRNQGRVGAASGPSAIRSALAPLGVSPTSVVYDLGDFGCQESNLEALQQGVASKIQDTLHRQGLPLVLGGGHEIAWASYQGAQQYWQQQRQGATLGILNFDAHFDLRHPHPTPSSGTPFRQALEWAEKHQAPTHYLVVGLNPSANTRSLFQFAQDRNVDWIEDLDCQIHRMTEIQEQLSHWLDGCDALYLSCCLDVFPAGVAPGVSAPAGVGIQPGFVLSLVRWLLTRLKEREIPLLVADIAEMLPERDCDQRTARLAARYLFQVINAWGPGFGPQL